MSTSAPRVSALLPVYNGLPYVAAAVESLLGQSFRDLEVVAVDDGSADGSGDVLDAFAARDPRVRVLHQANGGIVAALTAGLAAARGEYVARMDADDRSYPDRLARQVAYLDAHPAVGALGTGSDVGTPDGTHARQPPTSPALVRWELRFNNPMTHPTVTMRRSAVEAVGGYRADYPHNEDYDLWDRLAAVCDVTNLPERLLWFNEGHDANVGTVHGAAQFEAALQLQHAIVSRDAPEATVEVVRDLFCLSYGLPLADSALGARARIERSARLVVALRDAFIRQHPGAAREVRADAARKLTALETALRLRAGLTRVGSMRTFAGWDPRALATSLSQRAFRTA